MPPRITVNQSSSLAFTAGIIAALVSLVCILASGITYWKYPDRSLAISTVRPFVRFNDVAALYNGITQLRQAVQMNTTLLNTGWCNEPTGNYYLYPENRAPSCDCINRQYAGFMGELLTSLVNNTTSLARVNSYILQPWNNDTFSMNIIRSYNNSTVAVSSVTTAKYYTNTINCIPYHPPWKIEPYYFRVHPCAMFFYTSLCLFIAAFSYLLRVETTVIMGYYMKFCIILMATLGGAFMIIITPTANWWYALAIGCVVINYTFGLQEELKSIIPGSYTSVNQLEANSMPTLFDDAVNAPHPILVAIWNFIVIFFPMMVVYMGVINFARDVMCLLGFYVVGYLLSAIMMRTFWSKWYLQKHFHTSLVQFNYPHQHYFLTEKSAKCFRVISLIFLSVMFWVMTFFLFFLLYLGWNPNILVSGGVLSIITFSGMAVLFFLEMWAYPVETDGPLHFSQIHFIQVVIVCLCNGAMVGCAVLDTLLT